MTLEEIESEMRRNLRVDAPQVPSGVAQGQVQEGFPQPQGYQAQFPAVGRTFPALGGQAQHAQGMFGQPMQMQQPMYPLDSRGPPGLAPGTTANPDLARLLGVAPADPVDEERMNAELEQKIRETEVAEGKRRRKAEKIAGMARYNGIMTQGASFCCVWWGLS